MLNTQDVVNFFNDKLNEIGTAKAEPLSFHVVAEIGEPDYDYKINGVLRSLAPEFTPVNGYVEGRYAFAVDLIVPAPKTNKLFLQVQEIVSEFVKGYQDARVTLGEGMGILTLNSGSTGRYDVKYDVGEAVPLNITARITYTENAVTSSDKHWLLNGVEIPFLRERVTLEQEGMQRKMFTNEYRETLLIGHTRYYNFAIPQDSVFCAQLQTAILQNPAVKYTLTYYDGVSFTQDEPFSSTVEVFTNAVSASQKPEGSLIEITFTDAYSSAQKPLTYAMALIDFPFDMGGEDTRYFKSQEEQSAYFEAKASASTAPFVEIDAPTLENLFITKQVYKNNANPFSQFDYVSKNYAIIKAMTDAETKYFYYFVQTATIGSNGQVLLDLKMDTVQTYFFDEDVVFSDCLIERAHLDRFKITGLDTVEFISDPASKIFNAEEGLNFPKRLVERTKLNLNFTGNATVDNWLNENVAYWVYVFIDPTAEYGIGMMDKRALNPEAQTYATQYGKLGALDKGTENTYPIGLNGKTGIVAFPIYKNFSNENYLNDEGVETSSFFDAPSNVIKIVNVSEDSDWGTTEIYLHQSALDFLGGPLIKEENTVIGIASPYFYNMKVSILPPFDVSQSGVTIDENNNLVLNGTSPLYYNEASQAEYSDFFKSIGNLNGEMGRYVRTDFNVVDANGAPTDRIYHSRSALMITTRQTKTFLPTEEYLTPYPVSFFKSAITAPRQAPNPAYNPKLNGQNFRELVIATSSGDTFSYDIQKLVTDSLTFEYSEPIVPEVSRYYMRVEGGTGLYESGTDENYMGNVGTVDNALLFTNDQFAAFLANNKNFFMQSNIKIGTEFFKNAVSAIKNGNAVEGAGQMAGGVLNAGLALIDRSMTVDNMKNAPDQVKNANGSVIFNSFVTDLGLYVEIFSALDGDLKTANDFMNMYGFTYGAIDNVKDYANRRKYHNYVKAQLQSISGNLNNTARADLRERFANGVRFWNQDNVSYAYENYENFFDE